MVININLLSRIYLIFFLIILFYDVSKAQISDTSDSLENEERTFKNKKLGINFQYTPSMNYFNPHAPVDIGKWKRRVIKQLGISFKSPIFYKASWEKGDFHNYYPTDSVFVMDYGNGVSVDIFISKSKFPEIAYAEGFIQDQGKEPFSPEDEVDTIPKVILDSCWAIKGLSGMYHGADYISGDNWNGLRCESDTRASVTLDDGASTSCVAECWFSLLIRPIAGNRDLVVFYQQWPPDEEQQTVQRLDEQDFYDLVSTIELIKNNN